MKKTELLRELQDLDSALDRARESLEEKAARCGDDSELVPFREAMESARRQLHTLQVKGKELDHQLETETVKRKAEEKKLYGGSVKSPKELASLAREVELRKEQIGELETQALLNMDALEGASAAQQGAQRSLAEKEQAWKAEQATLEAECASLNAEVERLAAARNRVAGQIDPATLRNYDMIRRTRGGLAVVPIEQRACKGCRISLSSSEVQRARTSPEPISCQSCGRILYLP
ncbi:MAG: C4-type zinc ribbon domain-containing protein [Chloroflexi bacterium]|nr:C4-type zinc ribbon domain-containing protein [Chloroflexota bacterium]